MPQAHEAPPDLRYCPAGHVARERESAPEVPPPESPLLLAVPTAVMVPVPKGVQSTVPAALIA